MANPKENFMASIFITLILWDSTEINSIFRTLYFYYIYSKAGLISGENLNAFPRNLLAKVRCTEYDCMWYSIHIEWARLSRKVREMDY